ncbi:hypothetical protein EW026_g4925 [Hermanssonia centrifuga]|uniref:Thioesterase domain-containing protein n=1 Tax=Hermanssonia centrifuga TaxID=98765 RepID=A0A4S4KFX6_9APHY|nr:hypothetical protein EW026_g4925 [Hermanssonia centrifuga]
MRSAKGNVPQSIKDSLAEWYSGAADLHRFAAPIARRLEATEMSVYDKTEEPGKKEAKMVFEIDVTEGEGCRLKIVNTTMALGGRVMTARAEIYDITHNRLVASGVHIKMPPSAPKL